jgi:signal transduction histidine kinase
MRNTIADISRFFTGLRFRLLLLLLMVCAPLIILTLHTASQDRRAAEAKWRQRVQGLAPAVTRDEASAVSNVKTFLAALSDSEAVRAGNKRACETLVTQVSGSGPGRGYATIGVLAPDGEILASAGRRSVWVNQSQQGFFRRALETRSFAAGDLSGTTIFYGLPIIASSNEVVAVVFAALDLEWRSEHGADLQQLVPAGATLMQIAADGTVLAQYANTSTGILWRIGEKITDTNLLATVFGGSTRGTFEVLDAEGVKMVQAYAPTRSMLVRGASAAVLGIPEHTLYAEADRFLARNLTWLGGAIGAALLAGWIGSSLLILRPVRILVRTSSRVAAGDLSARTGLNYPRDELGQLARAFDVMASTLEKRELERRRDNKKLQVLSHRLVEVQESERRQIARELHDEVGQSLTAAEINLQAALAGPNNTPATESRLRASSEMIQHVLEQVQDLSLNLRPSMLDDLGLESALRWYTGRQAEISGIEARFESDPLERRLDPVIETGCFRVAQEALTNVLRHSRASSVLVELKVNDGNLHLLVRDDGVGFDVAAARDQAVRGGSLGVLSMEERAVLAGGKLELGSVVGQGTEVQAWFPLKWREQI